MFFRRKQLSLDDELKELDDFSANEIPLKIEVDIGKDKRRRKILAMMLEEFERVSGHVDMHTFNQIIKI